MKQKPRGTEPYPRRTTYGGDCMNNSYNYYPNPAAPVKKKGFPAWAAVVILLSTLAIIAAVVFAVFGRNPLLSVRSAVKTSLKAAEASEAVEIVSTAADCGSVSVSLDGRGLTADLLGMEIDAGAQVKFYFNLKNSSETALEASLSLNGAEAADLTAYTDGESAAVKSEAILGAKTYGFRFDEVREKFDGSIWGPGGAYDLQNTLGLDMTGEELADLFESFASSGKSKEEGEAVCKSVAGDLLKLLDKYSDTDTKNGEVEFPSGEIVRTKDVRVSLEGEKLYEFLKAALEAVRDNKRLTGYLESHPDVLSRAGIESAEDLGNKLGEQLETLENEREDVEKYVFVMGFCVSRENRQLVEVDFTVDKKVGEDSVNHLTGELICGPNWKEPGAVMFLLSSPSEDMQMSGSVITKRDDNGGFRSDLSVSMNGEGVAEGYLEKDGGTGAFTLSLTVEDTEFEAKGEYHRAEKDVTVIALDSVGIGGERYTLTGTSLTVKEKDEMPVITDWDDALAMTEADVDRVYEDIGAFVGTFQEKLAETIGFLAYLLF